MADQPSKESLERAQVEALAAEFHEVYQQEARRQRDVRHKDAYADLPENIKEFDRVLARHVITKMRQQNAALVSALRLAKGWILHGMPVSARYPRGHALPEIEKALAPYAPAEAEAKEKP